MSSFDRVEVFGLVSAAGTVSLLIGVLLGGLLSTAFTPAERRALSWAHERGIHAEHVSCSEPNDTTAVCALWVPNLDGTRELRVLQCPGPGKHGDAIFSCDMVDRVAEAKPSL